MAKFSEQDLLLMVRDEQSRSIGWDGGTDSPELVYQREKALRYYKGDMSDDFGDVDVERSTAVSTDVADAIEQALPTLVEVFKTEDVAKFKARDPQDEEAAKQETEYLNYVVCEQNDSHEVLHTVFKDALLLKTGIFYWQWEEAPEPEEEAFTKVSIEEAINANQTNPEEFADFEDHGDGTYSFVLRQAKKEGKVVIKAWKPEDLTVSEDTVKLGDGTYCAFRSRVRRDQLIVDGYDAKLVAELPSFNAFDNPIEDARSTVGEQNGIDGASITGMDTVEIVYHYLRVVEGKASKLYLIVTASELNDIVLHKEEVERVPAAAITPFPISHRFYGLSMADKLMETQRLKTGMLRLAMDYPQFQMYGRYEISESHVTSNTIEDMLKHGPGRPIRTKTPGGINALPTSTMAYNPWEALEALSAAAEQKTGIMRSAMGLAPDSLHETKGGMLAMMNQGQLRIRFIARNFAEGYKDMLLGVHDLIRKKSTIQQVVKLRGQWVPINPASWSLRNELEIEIGNAGGREYDVAAMTQIQGIQAQMVSAQGGLEGALVGPKEILESSHALVARLGRKDASKFFKDPLTVEAPQQQDPSQSPDAMKLQAELQGKMAIEQGKGQITLQLEQSRAQTSLQIARERLQMEYQFKAQLEQAKLASNQEIEMGRRDLDILKLRLELAQRDGQLEAEIDLKAQIADREVYLKEKEIEVRAKLDMMAIRADAERADLDREFSPNITEVFLGGEPG